MSTSWAVDAIENAAMARAFAMQADMDMETMMRPGWTLWGLDKSQLFKLRAFYEQHTGRPAYMVGKPLAP